MECHIDNDCPFGQFCYISRRCVHYLDCSRYNRMNGQIGAREPMQCGPCMEGYIFETLSTGQEAPSCIEDKNMKDQIASDTQSQIKIILSLIGVILIFIGGLILYCFLSKRKRASQTLESNEAPDALVVYSSNALASAPPEDEKPFIGINGKRCCIPDNNNERIETNECQTSIPCTVQYRRIDAYASHMPANNNSNANNNPNNNLLPREIAIQAPEDQQYGNIRTSQAGPSNHNDDDNGDTIDSASHPNNSNKKDSDFIKLNFNQMVHQNITANINLINTNANNTNANNDVHNEEIVGELS